MRRVEEEGLEEEEKGYPLIIGVHFDVVFGAVGPQTVEGYKVLGHVRPVVVLDHCVSRLDEAKSVEYLFHFFRVVREAIDVFLEVLSRANEGGA